MTEQRPFVVVLGMHRSGTSLAAGLLHRMGVHMGRYLVPPRGDNPRGFFENQEIVEVHKRLNRLLLRRPMSLSGTLHMPSGWLERPEVRRYQAQLREIVRAELADAGGAIAGFKDPHTARMLPLWQEIFAELGLAPRYVVCTRHPAAVAESLRRRDNIRRGHAELLWVQHYLDALRIADDAPLTVVEFEDWFSDFDAQYFALAGAAGVSRDEATVFLAAARSFASVDLDHAPPDVTLENPLAADLHGALQSYRTGRHDRATFSAVMAGMQRAADGFGFWSDVLGGELPALSPAWETLAGASAPMPQSAAFTTLRERLAPDIGTARTLKVCIVTYELEGPVRNSGRGSWAADLAVALASAGHAVTILYVPRDFSEDGDFDHWVAHYAALGVELAGMGIGHGVSDAKWLRMYQRGERLTLCRPPAFNVYLWLRNRDFDVVHAPDARAVIYYSLLAKRLDMSHSRNNETIFHVRAVGPDKWRLAQNALPMDDVQDLATAYMERRVVELADVVTATAPELLAQFRHDHYALAQDRVLVLPHVGCRHTLPSPDAVPVEEIVFLGSLEPRKGLHLFVDAMTWLQREGGPAPRVRFLGAVTGNFPAQEYLHARTASWRAHIILDTNRTRAEVLKLLSDGGRLVVLAGTESHVGVGLAECIELGIPFIAADSPANRWALGTQASDILFAPHPHRLAHALRNRLAELPPRVPPAKTRAVERQTWLDWHAAMATDPDRWRRQFHFQPRSASEATPLVSVCVAHFNRPHFLRHSLASLEAQTYQNIEVIVVDDGSTEPEAVRYLEEIEPILARRGWQVVRQENRYLGAVRNTGARHARGKYCLFMDDDNYAKPVEVESFVRIAERTGAEILTCFADVFHGDGVPDPDEEGRHVITQLGDNMAMGLFRNGFGDSNCFVQRDFFLDLGGNSEDYKVGKDDQEFFARAVLNGARLFLVPEALYWYRETPIRMRSLHYNLYAGNLRVMRPYLSSVPPMIQDMFRFAQGQWASYQKHLGRQQFLRRVIMEVLQSESWRVTRPLRSLAGRLRGKDATEITIDQVESSRDPGLVLASLYASFSWQVTGPWRVFRRAISGLATGWRNIQKRR